MLDGSTRSHRVYVFIIRCGHCKKLAPGWDELAAKYAEDKNIGIAKLDVTASSANKKVANAHKVKGFPTLLLFSENAYYKYSSPRTLEAFSAFIDGGYKALVRQSY